MHTQNPSQLPAVLITGGAQRIGAGLSRAFGEAGWHVVIHYRNSGAQAEALAASLPSAETIGFDLADADALANAVQSLAARLPDWRALVNCASVFAYDSVTGLDPATYNQAMTVNALASVTLAQGFLKHAQAAEGRRVIQFTDMKLENTNPDFFSYTMSKHAVAGAIPMLSMALPDARDRIYGLAPGAILASHDQAEEETDISHRLNLLNRKTGLEEITDTALFMAGGWLESGTTVFVDSGQHLLQQSRDVIYLAREGSNQGVPA
ncbi:SDR family NAD(P)-dependent oxidoreductase [Qipengyuania sp. DSG2-2]|uniref:SDR family NAD(P)-dependent oxidoreductase n=1 Tax=Qipengyuania sp. DGS2-2 TaxID=3349631 RepID=UPI0036D2F04E